VNDPRHISILIDPFARFALPQLFLQHRFAIFSQDLDAIRLSDIPADRIPGAIKLLKRKLPIDQSAFRLCLRQTEFLNIDASLRFYDDALGMLATFVPGSDRRVISQLDEKYFLHFAALRDLAACLTLCDQLRTSEIDGEGRILNVGRFLSLLRRRERYLVLAANTGLHVTRDTDFEWDFVMAAGRQLAGEAPEIQGVFRDRVAALDAGMHETVRTNPNRRLSAPRR